MSNILELSFGVAFRGCCLANLSYLLLSGAQATLNSTLKQRDFSEVIMAMQNLHPNKPEDEKMLVSIF